MDKMEQIYACVRDRDRSKNALLATVTEGAAAGEKAYVEDGRIQIQKGTFFTGERKKTAGKRAHEDQRSGSISSAAGKSVEAYYLRRWTCVTGIG